MCESLERPISICIYDSFFCNRLDKVSGKWFSHSKYIFLFHKAHFTIYLVKFTRMPIRSWILITKTWSDLEVFIDSSYHEDLFILLRCLRKCIEFSMMETRWNKIITCPLRRRYRKYRGLHFKKSILCEPITSEFIHLGPESNLIKNTLSSKIKVSILEANLFTRSSMLRNFKWWNFTLRKDFCMSNDYFNISC